MFPTYPHMKKSSETREATELVHHAHLQSFVKQFAEEEREKKVRGW
jgi:hypothetical protein